MDFTKFVSLLETKALFFSTIAILREQDKHEGTYNQATIEAHKVKQDRNELSIFDIGSNLLRTFGKILAINCWHMNEIESVAMWNTYLRGSEGIAIQSTSQRLADSLTGEPAREISIGKVHYLAEDEIMPEPDGINGLNSALWKWKSYQYENELRAVLISRPEELYQYNGIYIPVKLDQLIEKVVVSPKAPKWFSELVASLTSKYGFGEKVIPSRLAEAPQSIEASDKLSIELTCPKCNFKQEFLIEPFTVQEYSDNSTVLFSADRVSTQCKNCGQGFYITPGIQMKYSDSNEPSNKID